MKAIQMRQAHRVSVKMNLRSVQLPQYKAEIVDLSTSGAKLKLRALPEKSLKEERIRFAASLPSQIGQAFEGYARVVWTKKTASGVFLGLEWEKMSESAWLSVKAALVQAAA